MKKLISLIFVCLLSAPAAVWLIQLDSGLPMERVGLHPPRLYRQAFFDNDYYLSFDQYFNDSFSLRSPLIFSKRWLDYHIFDMTDVPDVHVGTNGWLYSRRSIEDYRKEACDSKAEIGRFVLELHALEKIIDAAGRRFLFFVVPDKSTVYPEFVGYVPRSTACNHSRLDLLLEFMAAHPMKGFVRLDDLLRQEKYSYALLYDKNSTHLNEAGAMIAAEAIHRIIFEGTWEDQRLDYRPISMADRNDLGNRLIGFSTKSEDHQAKQSTFAGQPGLPLGVAYSDDSMQTLRPYALQMFSKLEVLKADRVPSRQQGENLGACDVILIEKFESALDRIHIGIDEIFSIFEDEARIPARQALDLSTAMPLSHIDMRTGSEGLEIKSVGADSTLGLESIPASDDTIFRVLKLSIEAPHSDLMTVHYMTGLPYVTSKSLKPGLNNVYLPLSFQKSLSLHIHPGKKAGLFLLRSAEILEFSGNLEGEEPFQEKTSVVVADIKSDKEAAALPPMEPETPADKLEPEPDASSAAEDITVKDGTRQAASGDMKFETPPNELESVPGASPAAEDIAVRDDNSQQTVAENAAKANPKEFPVTNSSPMGADSKEPAAASKTDTRDFTADSNDTDEKNDAAGTAPEIAAMPVPEVDAIILTDFEEGRIFQRRGRSADIVVSGKYTGKVEALEARVMRDNTPEEVVPWTTIDAAPRKGIFLGTLPRVPQGGWYRLQVRSTGNHAVSANGRHKWGVGILVAALGQSNMKEWFYTGTDLEPNSLLRKFTNKGWSETGRRGNAAIAFGNRIIDKLGIPVGLLDYSISGSGLRKEADWGTGYWENTASGSIYNRFLAGISETGGAVEFVVWTQGEADAARGTVTEDEYRTSLESFITNQIRTDIANGSDRQYLPFLIVSMVKRPGGKDKPNQAIRNAQKYVAENVAGCYLAATTLDLENHGRQHLSPDAYVTMGRRVAQTVLNILGIETYHRGPWVSGLERVDDRAIDVKITHRGGTDFTPASGITGWEVLMNGEPLPIKEVYRQDPRTIRIILEKPLVDKAIIRYLYGAMPDASRPVRDNSALALPLEEYQSVLQ